jgi:hypothetical protein
VCADFRGSTLIKFAEMRRLELVDQAEEFRLADLAARGESQADRRIDLRRAMETLGDRIRMMLRPRSLTRPIEFEPATESAWHRLLTTDPTTGSRKAIPACVERGSNPPPLSSFPARRLVRGSIAARAANAPVPFPPKLPHQECRLEHDAPRKL